MSRIMYYLVFIHSIFFLHFATLIIATNGAQISPQNYENSESISLQVITNRIKKSPKSKKQWFDEGKKRKTRVRIVGGKEVKKSKYPWFARQVIIGFGDNIEWDGCGGSLIASDFILTAAHCLDQNEQFAEYGGYQIGALCPESTTNCGQLQITRSVSEIFMHPKFDPWWLDYDIALVKLNRPTIIKPVKFDRGFSDMFRSYGREKLFAAGFGELEYYGPYPSRLMEVELDYMTNKMCKRTGHDSHAIFDSMMCAAGENKDACVGDSGGPLYDPVRDLLVGVISWGENCALKEYPGVFSRVSHVASWIEDTICKHSESTDSICS